MATHSTLNRLPHDLRNQRGFTLIELMISLVIGLLLSAAIVKIYADTSQIYRFQGAVSEVQENGRFASAFLRRTARLAGNFGCDASKPISSSTLSVAEATRLEFFSVASPLPQPAQPIGGVDGGGTNSDELILRGSTGGGVRLVAPDPGGPAADLTVENDSGITVVAGQDTFGVISDCNRTEIFKINSVGSAAAGDTIDFDGTLGATYTTAAGARVQEIEEVRYCIGEATAWTAANDLQALLLLRNPRAGQTCARDGEELVEGIQNLQVRYGIDTNNDGFANRYITAPDPWTTADLANVRTLRVELVVRSLANGITRAPVPYTLEGNVITPAADDLHLYKVMTSTISLRNKGT
jgi:type IV pilus assembly protein PilW